jgi:hypothetical protein
MTLTTDIANFAFNAGGVNTGSFKRNRIINGNMLIAQRGTSFSTPAAGTYTLDRWSIGWGGAAPASVAQVSGPAGFKNAAQITGAASNALLQFIQRIESFNCADLSGQTVTLQANIATSSNQTVLWALKYATAQDNFTSVTTISSGTWSTTSTATTFTATVTGLPAGVSNGLQIEFYPNNAGAFTSGTITITGVQLEAGSIATPYERQIYSDQLSQCQRYYQIGGLESYRPYSGTWQETVYYKVPLRYAPTVTLAVQNSSAVLSGPNADNGYNNTYNANYFGYTYTLSGGGYCHSNFTASSEL